MSDEPLLYLLFRRFIRFLVRLLARLDVSGEENIPRSGPLIVAPNHLHVMDAPVVYALVPRRMTVFAAEKWQYTPTGWLMRAVANAIFVVRGEPDRKALAQALEVLRRGGTLGMAPEGTRSRSGGLIQGKNGVAYLAARTDAVIVPVALWGQERILPALVRGQRAEVHVRFMPPLRLPSDAARARTAELQGYTEELMLRLAVGLPSAYRGVYAEKAAERAGRL